MRKLQGVRYVLPFCLILFSENVQAVSPDDTPLRQEAERQFQQQEQQQKAREDRLAPGSPDVRLSPPSSGFGRLTFPPEKHCFQIEQVQLSGQASLPHWLPLQRIAHQAQGYCLGNDGINMLMRALQNRLVDSGYITTRVLAPSQDLNSGTPNLMIISGRVRQVRLTPDSDRYIQLYTVFPAHGVRLENGKYPTLSLLFNQRRVNRPL